MLRFRSGLIVVAALVVSACQSTSQSVQSRENLLAAAGFTIKQHLADEQRMTAIMKMPSILALGERRVTKAAPCARSQERRPSGEMTYTEAAT